MVYIVAEIVVVGNVVQVLQHGQALGMVHLAIVGMVLHVSVLRLVSLVLLGYHRFSKPTMLPIILSNE
jgi:hypothetical protein